MSSMRVVKDLTKSFSLAVKSLESKATLVGIPADESKRADDSPITNAALLYINNFGSPAQNIPARPVMDIGIRNAQDEIIAESRVAAQKVLSGDVGFLDKYHDRIGIIGSNSIKKAINDQDGIEPIAFATALARARKGFKGDKALIVTGQMRNAITWVVR